MKWRLDLLIGNSDQNLFVSAVLCCTASDMKIQWASPQNCNKMMALITCRARYKYVFPLVKVCLLNIA